MKRIYSLLSCLTAFLFLSNSSVSAQVLKMQRKEKTPVVKSLGKEIKTEQMKQRMSLNEPDGLFRTSHKAKSHPVDYVARSTKAGDKATITLVVQMDWGDGSGYQMLLDADHNTFGTVIPAEGAFSTSPVADYSEFEYTIPEGADGNSETDKIVTVGESVSIEIEPGIYDFCIVNPTPGDRIWIAGGEMARVDDMEFSAGIEYVFTVEGIGNGDNCELEVITDYNVAVTNIISPENKVDMTAEEDIVVELTNKGLKEITSVKLSYSIDGGTAVEETATLTIAPGEKENYTFTAKADLSAEKRYEILVKAQLENDEDASNDSLRKVFWHISPVAAPYTCYFDDESSMENWVVYDMNKDGNSWMWFKSSYDTLPENGGCARIVTDGLSEGEPEYMVTLRPISLKEGNNHISYYQEGFDSDEHLIILYGESSNIGEMEVLGEREHLTDAEWALDLINFTLEKDGDYYFAFGAYKGSNPWMISIDHIEIAEGHIYGVPDLNIDQLLLPISSCGLTTGNRIGMRVTNNGMGDVTNFTIRYTINDGTPVEQTLSQKIGVKETKDIYFDTEADFSTEDKTYAIAMEIVANPQGEEKAEENLDNNRKEGKVTHYTPTGIPFLTHFNVEEERANWATVVEEDWYYDENSGYYWNLAPTPLYSRCVTLEASKEYRFTMNYGAGDIIWIFQVMEDIAVVYGKTGTDISTWDTIMNLKEQFTDGKIVEEYVSIQPKDDGNYTFAIVPVTCNMSFHLSSINISEVMDYDIRLTKFTGIPGMMPAEHANSTFDVAVAVKNVGKEKVEKAKVSVMLNDKSVGSKEFALGDPNASAEAMVSVTPNGLKEGDKAEFIANAEIVGQTEEGSDNQLSRTSIITKDILAYDKVTEEMCSDENYIIGAETMLYCGVLMNFGVKDTLTGVSVMWGASEKDLETKIIIYRFNPEEGTLGEMIYSGSITKGTAAGEKRYEIPAMLLDKGYYLVTVGVEGYILATDMDADGMLYLISGNESMAQDGLGTPGIRAIFGQGKIPYEKDAYVAEISKPASEGLFAENEPIVVKIGNQGYTEQTFPVYVTVNGEALEAKNVTVPAYGNMEIEFVADLSAPATEYNLVAYTALEGDENKANDTVKRTVRSMEPANPYEMNFEYCSDFAIEGFNPEWKSVDLDASDTYGFQGINFPNAATAFGFMAFNPAMTEPAMTAEEMPEIQPYAGNRFGAAFASQTKENNDWLISPKLLLPTKGAEISLFVKTFLPDYGLEAYKVLVSATEEIDDFVELHSAEAPAEAWEEVTIDLSDYAGKSVYLAIQCVSTDRFIFMVDNIKVSKPETANESDLTMQLNIYPNPAREMIMIHSTEASISQVSIYNISGVEIYSSKSLNTTQFSYNVSKLSSGIYFARIQTNLGTSTLKFVVH